MAKRKSGRLNERLARPFFAAARRLGIAGREVADALTRASIGLEAAATRRLEAEAAAEAELPNQIVGSLLDEAIDPANIAEAFTKIRREYSWTIRTDVIDRSGTRRSLYTNVSTDQLLTGSEAIEEAEAGVIKGEYGIEREGIVSSSIVGVVKAGPAGKL